MSFLILYILVGLVGFYMYLIEKYDFGRIKVSGKTYFRDIIIFPNEILPNWWRKEGHNLCMEDLEEIIKRKPDILVIGNGYSGVMRVPRDVVEELEKMGIRVIVKNTREAVKEYNRLAQEGKNVAAALHLTC